MKNNTYISIHLFRKNDQQKKEARTHETFYRLIMKYMTCYRNMSGLKKAKDELSKKLKLKGLVAPMRLENSD